VLALPEGSEYDLWKAENAKFIPSTNAVSQKFEEVIRRHLGVAGHPKEYSIAAHHWKLPLLCYRIDPVNRSRKWVKAITAKQAKDSESGLIKASNTQLVTICSVSPRTILNSSSNSMFQHGRRVEAVDKNDVQRQSPLQRLQPQSQSPLL
jgi:hypothetical protein